MKCITESQRPRRDERSTGVNISTYISKTVKKGKGEEYIRIKFIGSDVDRLAGKIRVELSDDEERMYFEPSERGFTVSPENKSSSSSVIAMPIKKEYRPFVGEYPALKYDSELHLFYVELKAKASSEQITLTKEEYEKVKELVAMFSC